MSRDQYTRQQQCNRAHPAADNPQECDRSHVDGRKAPRGWAQPRRRAGMVLGADLVILRKCRATRRCTAESISIQGRDDDITRRHHV